MLVPIPIQGGSIAQNTSWAYERWLRSRWSLDLSSDGEALYSVLPCDLQPSRSTTLEANDWAEDRGEKEHAWQNLDH